VPGIERVKQATLLGIDVTDTLSTAAYVDRLLMQVNQRLYLLSLPQSSGLQCSSLNLLFNALVINKLTYALPAYASQLTVDDKNRINAISGKAMCRGLTLTAFDIDTIIDKSDCRLFRQATNPGHSLHHLLPQKPPLTDLTKVTSYVRGNIHICFLLFNIPSLKIVSSIGVYLNMYNLLLAYSCHVPLA